MVPVGSLGGPVGSLESPGGSLDVSGGSLEALGNFQAPQEGFLAVLLASRRAPGAGLEASWAQMAPILGVWVTFLIFWGPSLERVFYCCLMIWGTISG